MENPEIMIIDDDPMVGELSRDLLIDAGYTVALIQDSMEAMTAIKQMHPLGIGTARDVAYAIAFLLAETGRWVTGSALIVDGGYTAR